MTSLYPLGSPIPSHEHGTRHAGVVARPSLDHICVAREVKSIKNTLFLFVSALAVTACSEAASESEGVTLEPGSWEVVMGTTELDIPGLSPDQLETARIDENVGYPTVEDMCFEEADLRGGVRSFIEEIIIADLDCKDDVSIADGKIGGAVVCTPADKGADVTMNFEGTYDAQNFDMDISSRLESDEYPRGVADTVVELRGKRIEDCY